MLSQLYIENVAVVEEATVNFEEGLNVLTGETGAGKSIVIDSINAILGKRMSRDIIRTGANFSRLYAMFSGISSDIQKKLSDMGFPLNEDNSLLIQREISASNKNLCRINGRPATVAMLKSLGVDLISIHGQNDTYELMSPEVHITYIDRLGDLNDLLKGYQEEYNNMLKIKHEIHKSEKDKLETARRIDLLNYQIQELKEADLKIEELEELKSKRTQYVNSEKIALALSAAKSLLNGQEEYIGAIEGVERAANHLGDIESCFPSVDDTHKRLESVLYELKDCFEEIGNLLPEIKFDPEELNDIELRLDYINKLSKKYGNTIEDMLKFLNSCEIELEEIDLYKENKEALIIKYNEVKNKTQKLAENLSKKRRSVSLDFSKRVKKELEFLNMPDVRFEVEQKLCELSTLGIDSMQFLISTNIGEDLKSLSKIASGGELSRIMLAIKTVLASKDNIDTLIFDEIDTGLSGSASEKVGLKLREVSKNSQVICVTHSPQIAALAKNHFLIEKSRNKNRTVTSVKLLDLKERTNEIARIIGGLNITKLTLQKASEMLILANEDKF